MADEVTDGTIDHCEYHTFASCLTAKIVKWALA